MANTTGGCFYTALFHFELGTGTVTKQPTAPDCSENQQAGNLPKNPGDFYACVAIPAGSAGKHFSSGWTSLHQRS